MGEFGRNERPEISESLFLLAVGGGWGEVGNIFTFQLNPWGEVGNVFTFSGQSVAGLTLERHSFRPLWEPEVSKRPSEETAEKTKRLPPSLS